jgi:Uma2 family endonuclease
MAVMASATGLPYGRPLTADDLDAIPDDGHRYELLDGSLLVTPAPGWGHQEGLYTLYWLLRAACPRGLRVIGAPFAVRLAPETELQPDILVARYEDLTPRNLPVAPLLAVEVRSPSTGAIDLTLKKAAYERFRVPSYWVLDPDPEKPALAVFELTAGHRYVEVAKVVGEETFVAERPFSVAVRPADLVTGLRPDG